MINVADFDLLNDQALTPQLLRTSKPLYALAATIPPPARLTGATTAGGELCLETTRCVSRTWQLDSTSWTNILIPMVFFAATSARDFSLGDREDRQMLVKTLRRRFPEEVHQTTIILIDCRAFRDPASSALHSESSQVPRFVAGFG